MTSTPSSLAQPPPPSVSTSPPTVPPSTTNKFPFPFPVARSYPPFYTLQPNTTSLQAQLSTWSTIIQTYCRHHRLFKLSLSDTLETDLLVNRALNRRLKAADARRVLAFMRDVEKTAESAVEGGRGESGGGGGVGGKGGKGKGGATADEANVWWIWWRTVEEWAEVVERWVRFGSCEEEQVDDTGQKNTVLTLYELTEGDLTRGTG
ncbi:MAG: hypothetical protein M1816_005311 [Peltula sp. TS41687]|nr:MAG: hypothetical protein M1816_005311 [Peltula sp. TS41687]